MSVETKKHLQITTEGYVKLLLQKHGHVILGSNVRRGKFEFDIISTKNLQQFVHEVRGTSRFDTEVIDHFPTKKILILFSGMNQHFMNAHLILHLVRVNKCQKMYCISVNALDVL